MNSPTSKIPAAVRELIDNAFYCHDSIRQVADFLPPDDWELDAWIGEAIAEQDQVLLTYLAVAAASRQRPFRAEHLAKGLPLLPNEAIAEWLVLNAVGDAPAAVLETAERFVMSKDVLAAALLAVTVVCQEERGGVLPANFQPAVRRLARGKIQRESIQVSLVSIAVATEDEVLGRILGKEMVDHAREKAATYVQSIKAARRESILTIVPATPSRDLASGTTMRRAVPRIGRNEVCPCGSGKKYKRCCFQKDRERLHLSTEVAGKTKAELRHAPAVGLTRARLQKMHPHELVLMRPTDVPAELVREYVFRLGAFRCFDRLAEACASIPWDEKERVNVWKTAMFFTMQSWQREVAEKLMEIFPECAELLSQLPGFQTFLASENEAAFVRSAEEAAKMVVDCEDIIALENFAYALVHSPYPALGILVARSMLSLLPQKEASTLFGQILLARDRLNLSPEDCFSEILAERFSPTAESAGMEADEVLRLKRRVSEKTLAENRLKERLAQNGREIARLEKAKTSSPSAKINTVPADAPTLNDLREKNRQLKSLLKEQHEDRGDLRRQLNEACEKLAGVEQAKEIPAAVQDDAEEGDVVTPFEQPVRLIEFQTRFRQSIAKFPATVARAAMTMIGRLAAGEGTAFSGVVRLKETDGILRQRIGSDYRLLFRLTSKNVCVLDLINRKDLLLTLRKLRNRHAA